MEPGLTRAKGFQWDKGNKDKNWEKHRVSNQECEEVFFDPNKKLLKDLLHPDQGKRFILIGKAKQGRLLFEVFTIRDDKIRVISARDLNEKEKYLYEEKN